MSTPMNAEEYLSKAVTAIPVYKLLWEQAVMLLPPVDPPEGTNVEVFFSATDLRNELNGARTVSNLRNELKWMQNWGWIKTRKGTSRRFLGRRKGSTFFLLADLAAKDRTKEKRLISREVLGVCLDELPDVTADEVVRAGAGRRWTGDPNAEEGGDLEHLLGE